MREFLKYRKNIVAAESSFFSLSLPLIIYAIGLNVIFIWFSLIIPAHGRLSAEQVFSSGLLYCLFSKLSHQIPARSIFNKKQIFP